jgi:uncharacterized paraquat-inducible protein A
MEIRKKYPMTIRPLKKDETKSSKLTKCSECYRITFRDNRCERCGHTNNRSNRILCL